MPGEVTITCHVNYHDIEIYKQEFTVTVARESNYNFGLENKCLKKGMIHLVRFAVFSCLESHVIHQLFSK